MDDSYSRAFSIATAACAASSCVSSSSSAVKSVPPRLLGQVEVSVRDASEHDRDAEKRLHRRVVAGESDRARVLGDLVQPQRLRVPDQHAEDAAPARQLADRRVGLGVDPRGEEALQPVARTIDDAERRVAGVRELGGCFHEPLQEGVERELRRERDPGVDEHTQPAELLGSVAASGRALRHTGVCTSRDRCTLVVRAPAIVGARVPGCRSRPPRGTGPRATILNR